MVPPAKDNLTGTAGGDRDHRLAPRRRWRRWRRRPGAAAPTAGPCATTKSGTRGKDRLVGTDQGDRLFGLLGGDLISGLAGDDCLFGNKGADRLFGGDGADQISGGNSRDRVNGGRGADTVRSGNARDVVKVRDGEADTVDCGGGDDRVIADAADNLSNCENVKRR